MATGSKEFLKEIDALLLETNIEEDSAGKQENTVSETSNENSEIREENISNDNSKISLIRSALERNENLDVISQLCAEGVPEEVRVDVWRTVLGLRRRPDTIGTWDGPLDNENQSLIHKHCEEQTAHLASTETDKELKTNILEQVITFYCKSRNMVYGKDSGIPELLGPLLALGFNKGDLFNCLYVLLAKHIPRDCHPGGKPFDLFRLLLLYHDPELCSILDTRKLSPYLYLQPWFRSLFANQCSLPVIHTLWDHYLLERDPFLIFFLALVMIINAKEVVTETPVSTPVEDLVAILSVLPQQLTVEDISDFVSLAQYYAARTPQSFRKDYHSTLFGSGRSLSSVSPGILCLPVHLQEVIDSVSLESQGLKYVLVDCRPLNHFSVGHVPGAMHLDTDLLLHSPQDFSTAMERLCEQVKQIGSEGGEHLCFFGSGREQEDQYMYMVVSKFLQQSIPYVSMTRGGFLELLRIVGSRAEVMLEDFDVEKCHLLYQDGHNAPSTVTTRTDNSDSDSESYSTSALYRQRLQARGALLYASVSTSWREKSQRLRVKFGEMWQYRQAAAYKDRPLGINEKKTGQKYRYLPDNVFVIADDDEDIEDSNEWSSEDDTSNPLVNISLYSTSPEITHSFPCSELSESGHIFPSHMLMTSDKLIVLREAPDRVGWGKVKHRELLTNIMKITAKKKQPDLITFKLGMFDDNEPVITSDIKLRIPNTRKATEAIKQQITKLQTTSNPHNIS